MARYVKLLAVEHDRRRRRATWNDQSNLQRPGRDDRFIKRTEYSRTLTFSLTEICDKNQDKSGGECAEGCLFHRTVAAKPHFCFACFLVKSASSFTSSEKTGYMPTMAASVGLMLA